jgi:signal transduction histidine kinase
MQLETKLTSSAIRVLLIDDDEDEFVITSDLLRAAASERYNVTWASSYEQGLQSVLSSPFDVCLVDYRLGKSNGLELISELTARSVDVPTILLTGDGDLQVDLSAMRNGASDYLTKDRLTAAQLERAIRYAVLHGQALKALRSATQAAESSTRAKSSFLAAMSHEIRTPMNAILGMADLLWETQLDDTQREYVRRFRRSGKLLLALINDILDLSKIDSGNLDMESDDFSIRALVNETVELHRPNARMKNIELAARVPPGAPDWANGDANRLQQILNNLIGNAIKFTERGNVILTVEAHPDNAPGHVRFQVADTGIGIPVDKVDTVFEDFAQAESSITRRFGGTGLGLGICRRLVESMGGKLNVQSVLGQGSTFFFDVFLAPAAVPVEAPMQRAVSQEAALQKQDAALNTAPNTAAPNTKVSLEILVVDDSEDNRFLISAFLAGKPCRLTFAENGLQAVEKFSKKQFGLVFMDIQMPVMDGLTAVGKIRALEVERSCSPTPIVALTAHAYVEDVKRCYAAGCDGHLSKPVSLEVLTSAIERFRVTGNAAVQAPEESLSRDTAQRVVSHDAAQRVPETAEEPFVIDIPAGFEQFSRNYIAARRRELPAMFAILPSGQLDQLRTFGHNMKGTAASFGFAELTELGAAIEDAAKRNNSVELGDRMSRVSAYIEFASESLSLA